MKSAGERCCSLRASSIAVSRGAVRRCVPVRLGAGIPAFSPHDLRHRRVSLMHLAGVPWARIGEQVGQDDITTTSRVYTHVVADEAELDLRRATLAEPALTHLVRHERVVERQRSRREPLSQFKAQ
jgi:integrase